MKRGRLILGLGLVLVVAIAIAIAVSATGRSLYSALAHTPFTGPSEVARLRARFVRNSKPVARIRLADLPQAAVDDSLWDPRASLPQSSRYLYGELAALHRFATGCQRPPHLSDPSLRKALTWHAFLCGSRKTLPVDFFTSPPYLHPSGRSYARLAMERGLPPFEGLRSLTANRQRFHVLELSLLAARGVRLSPPEAIFATLHPSELDQLRGASEVVMGSQFVWLRTNIMPGGEPSRLLDVYPRGAWDAFWSRTAYLPRPWAAGVPCLTREGNACWQENTDRALAAARTLAIVLGLLIALIAGFWIIALFRRARARRADEEQRRFILQTLTHELRHPAATLKVGLEGFRREYDRLPDSLQTGFLRMCNEVQRLDRLIAASTQYLHANSRSEWLVANKRACPSLNEYFRSLLDPMRDRVAFTPLDPDAAFSLDPYWLALCVRNLVENALAHGQPPVELRLERGPDCLRISVRDGGKMAPGALERLSVPFQKSATSRGLGLGLTIVRRVVASMGGELKALPSPTTFQILLPGDIA